ncbi:hypothetical protein KIPB_014112, partial [Kipferlia bialata]|eukprot:g14112.t1
MSASRVFFDAEQK